ncbi:universal stress protein [Methanoregula formicica]|uniref:Universal stress protein UspA-like protein n=1 Tax=Methanoregula formicica (strain DSM 22288 / NBRC 105244 / SMSP) TaxID=593750 RepID=L0HDB8_METFS|nr:universal stress protein [Methanoregula formicica]AGB01776.1 universal stress protein UspA-like protein [Methanoregula formicica SMSP]
MFENVLLPTDFSPDSQKVLEYVRDIPGVKKVILLHVVDATRASLRGWEHDPKIENAKILIKENQRMLEQAGLVADIKIETLVNTITRGNIPLTILEKAEREKTDLIVMGARGRNTIESILLGSVSANVTRHAKMPVLLMRFPPESCSMGSRPSLFSRILVPLDFSEPSRDALACLARIPAQRKVTLLHVVDKGESREEIQAAVGAAKENLAGIAHELAGRGREAEPVVHIGYPPDEITATADRLSATLILMSPKGEGWMRELRALIIGSTTSAVVRRAHRPVLITAGCSGE